jgi:hypothetical protein
MLRLRLRLAGGAVDAGRDHAHAMPLTLHRGQELRNVHLHAILREDSVMEKNLHLCFLIFAKI